MNNRMDSMHTQIIDVVSSSSLQQEQIDRITNIHDETMNRIDRHTNLLLHGLTEENFNQHMS